MKTYCFLFLVLVMKKMERSFVMALNLKLSVKAIHDLFHEKILFSQKPVNRGLYLHSFVLYVLKSEGIIRSKSYFPREKLNFELTECESNSSVLYNLYF